MLFADVSAMNSLLNTLTACASSIMGVLVLVAPEARVAM